MTSHFREVSLPEKWVRRDEVARTSIRPERVPKERLYTELRISGSGEYQGEEISSISVQRLVFTLLRSRLL